MDIKGADGMNLAAIWGILPGRNQHPKSVLTSSSSSSLGGIITYVGADGMKLALS